MKPDVYTVLRAYSKGIITEAEMRKALRQADGAVFGNPRTMEYVLGGDPPQRKYKVEQQFTIWRLDALTRYTQFRPTYLV